MIYFTASFFQQVLNYLVLSLSGGIEERSLLETILLGGIYTPPLKDLDHAQRCLLILDYSAAKDRCLLVALFIDHISCINSKFLSFLYDLIYVTFLNEIEKVFYDTLHGCVWWLILIHSLTHHLMRSLNSTYSRLLSLMNRRSILVHWIILDFRWDLLLVRSLRVGMLLLILLGLNLMHLLSMLGRLSRKITLIIRSIFFFIFILWLSRSLIMLTFVNLTVIRLIRDLFRPWIDMLGSSKLVGNLVALMR